MRGRIWAGVGLIIPMLLSACVTVQQAKDPRKSPATTDSGTVFVSITVNTGEVAAFSTIFLARDKSGPKTAFSTTYSLSNIGGAQSRDTALFAGNLPAGEYKLQRLVAPNNKFLDIGPAQADLIGSFRVEGTKVSDLGRLVLTAVNSRVVLGRSSTVEGNRTLASQMAPSYAKLLEGPAIPQPWTKPRAEGDLVEEYAMAYPIGATGLSEMPSGEVIAGSRMGVVLSREVSGRWKVLSRTGRLDAVLWTVPYLQSNNVAVVVGDLGTLMRVDNSGRAFEIPPGNLPFGAYFFVDHAPDHSAWVIGVQTDKAAALYMSPRLENGTWTELRSDTTLPSAWSGARGVWMWRAPGAVGFASTEKGKVECYNYATKHWRSAPVPDGRRLIGLSGGPGAGVGVLTGVSGGLAGVFAKTHYAATCGSAWIETDSPYAVKMSAPVLLPSGKIIEGGGAFGDRGLYRSADGGKTWTKVTSDVTVFSDRLWALERAGLFAISTGAFGIESVYHSMDEGQTWKLELSSINREVLRRQLNK